MAEQPDLSGLLSKPVVDSKIVNTPTPKPTITKANVKELLGGLPVESVDKSIERVSMLIFGDSGIGKTFLAGSSAGVPEMSPVLFLDTAQGGVLSLRRKYPDVKGVYLDDVRNTAYKGDSKVQAIKSFGWDQMRRVVDDLSNNNPYKTVVMDTGGEIYNLGMSKLMAEVVDHNPKMEDPEVPSMREYGIMLVRMRTVIKELKRLGCNVIVTAHGDDIQNKRTGAFRTEPDFPGKVRKQVPSMFDFVFYYSMKETVTEKPGTGNKPATKVRTSNRVIRTKATATVMAKDRDGLLPETIMDPTMAELYTLITNT
jgi:hypothetical protein